MNKHPKIAFMTTLGVNVGDEFIREGITTFLDEIFKNWEPYYVNKIDLTSLYRPLENETTVLEDKFRNADIIINAGAPLYWKIGNSTSYNVEWANELWEKRIFQLGPKKPILNIAVGACQPYPDFAKTFLSDIACVEFAKKVHSTCRWTSARDPLASQIIYALGFDHDALPCTAFHAARRIKIPYSNRNILGVNLMPFAGHYKLKEDIDEHTWSSIIKEILNSFRKYHSLLFIAHDLFEKEFMKSYIKSGENIFYSPCWRDYLWVYGMCLGVMANRVHGAVCAAGFGCPAVIIGNDTRLLIGDYIGLPSFYVSEIKADEIVDALEDKILKRNEEKERLINLREESAAQYRDAIIENLEIYPQNIQFNSSKKQNIVKLSSVKDLSKKSFLNFMKMINCFASRWGLQKFTNWSKVWEYPWIWFNGLLDIDWLNINILDIGSELGPMPWFFSSLGAKVTLLEINPHWIERWEKICNMTGLNVKWRIVSDEKLPFDNDYFDLVTSFSVIEHQKDKKMVVDEIVRVLKPGGRLAISFDICETSMGMTFPDWNGEALTMSEFEEIIWNHPGFEECYNPIGWNIEDIPDFIKWHLQSASYHNYVVGAAVLIKNGSL